jgi:hypothetical protein
MVDVDDPLAAVGDEFVVDAYIAELVLLPLTTVDSGILVPVSAAEDIREAVMVHVEHGNAFCMVGAQAMGEEGEGSLSAGAVPRMLHAELGCVCGILSARLKEGAKHEEHREDGPEEKAQVGSVSCGGQMSFIVSGFQ